mgnify:CR=1 FL=1
MRLRSPDCNIMTMTRRSNGLCFFGIKSSYYNHCVIISNHFLKLLWIYSSLQVITYCVGIILFHCTVPGSVKELKALVSFRLLYSEKGYSPLSTYFCIFFFWNLICLYFQGFLYYWLHTLTFYTVILIWPLWIGRDLIFRALKMHKPMFFFFPKLPQDQ